MDIIELLLKACDSLESYEDKVNLLFLKANVHSHKHSCMEILDTHVILPLATSVSFNLC